MLKEKAVYAFGEFETVSNPGSNREKGTPPMKKNGCVATFTNQQESDWLGRPGSVSCGYVEQLVDELNLLPNIRTTHPPRLTLLMRWTPPLTSSASKVPKS